MTRAVPFVFGVLVAATFAAFFVAQHVKDQPSVIQSVTFPGVFSPNQDGRRERVGFNLRLKEADRVTLRVLDEDGDVVRTLAEDRRIEAYRPLQPTPRWDGRDDDGRMAPDGRYRLRITLRDQGRAVVVPRSFLKDTTPPEPRVATMGPDRGFRTEVLPNAQGAPAEARFSPALDKAKVVLFRTGPGTPDRVHAEPLERGTTRWSWDGTLDGRRAPAGTYLVMLEWRDRAGNRGTSVPLEQGLPVLGGGRLPGRGGITVRYLAAQPPMEPTEARDRLQLFVDARGQRFRWSLRRLGASGPRARGGPKTQPPVTLRAPGGVSGAYLFEVRTRSHATRVVVPVQARKPVGGTRAKPRGVLVLLPAITWQGRNPVDDDGDGQPNLLDLGVSARQFRVMAGDGLPDGFAEREAPMLQWLDRNRRRYDLTTDAALLAGRGPQLEGHRGVLIPGDARWLPGEVRRQLRAFVRRGGRVVSLGTDSLRRTVAVSQRGSLTRASDPRPTDLFGARLRPLVRRTTDLEIFEDEQIGLFASTGGLVAGVPAWEETAAVGREAELVARAVTVDPPGRSVIVAARFGEGLVIRPGFPDFAPRLSTDDPAVSELMARMWTLLSR